MLLSGDLRTVTYDDLCALCEAKPLLREGVRLDFKQELPPGGINKQLAAFANTMGGVVLIGVVEQDSHVKLPLDGIEIKPGLRERIVSAALDGIYPPLYPEVEVIAIPGTKPERGIMIVRVSESAMAPHAIENRQRVYVRVDSVTKPHDREAAATLDQIERMWARRRGADEIKVRLRSEAREVAMEVLPNFGRSNRAGPHLVDLEFSMVPSFPAAPYASPSKVQELAAEADTWYFTPPLTDGEVFPFNMREYRPVNGGAMAFSKVPDSRLLYTQFHQLGLFYCGATISVLNPGDPRVRFVEGTRAVIQVELVNPLLASLLAKGANYIDKLSHHGLVDILITIDNVKGMGLAQKWGVQGIVQVSDRSFNSQLHVRRQVEIHKLRQNPLSVLEDLYENLTWAFSLYRPADLMDSMRAVGTLTFDRAFGTSVNLVR